MVPFFVQFKCKLGQSYAVANALAEAEIASEIYSIAGDRDILAKFYVGDEFVAAMEIVDVEPGEPAPVPEPPPPSALDGPPDRT